MAIVAEANGTDVKTAKSPTADLARFANDYLDRLKASCDLYPLDDIKSLGETLLDCWKTGRQVFIFGNGGSAGNAIHLANDWIYGISKKFGSGLRVTALPANSSVMTALANDEGYDTIFSYQLAVLAKPGDVAIALSGSGNSPNIVKALEYTKECGDQELCHPRLLRRQGACARRPPHPRGGERHAAGRRFPSHHRPFDHAVALRGARDRQLEHFPAKWKPVRRGKCDQSRIQGLLAEWGRR